MNLQRIEKPWGHELVLIHTECYAGKILCIGAGHRLSMQHHERKDETLFLLVGAVDLELEGETGERLSRRMTPDVSYHVPPGRRHRLSARTDARVLEISTPELDDVVRWEDDYGRVGARSGCAETPLPASAGRIGPAARRPAAVMQRPQRWPCR
jgi:mannose-6-phosphate isomerase-like protein (cupin superfamily)